MRTRGFLAVTAMLFAAVAGLATKDMPGFGESCASAKAIVAVECRAEADQRTEASYRVVEVLYNATGRELKKDMELSVEGGVFGQQHKKGMSYILFIDSADKGYRTVPQQNYQDSKEARANVVTFLRQLGKIK